MSALRLSLMRLPSMAQNLDHHLIALTQLVLHFLHAMLRDLGDVKQAIGAGGKSSTNAPNSANRTTLPR